MAPAPTCSLPWHNLLMDYSSAGETDMKGQMVTDVPAVGTCRLPAAAANCARSGLLSNIMIGNACITPLVPPTRSNRSSNSSCNPNVNEPSTTFLAASALPTLGSAVQQNRGGKRIQSMHRSGVTAAEINKLHQAVKLFRLLPPKTQMILKQVHPEGPLNSDIFAAIMAATECVPPSDTVSPSTYTKSSGCREKYARVKTTDPLNMMTPPQTSMHVPVHCNGAHTAAVPEYGGAALVSPPPSSSTTPMTNEMPSDQHLSESSWLETPLGTSTNSMTPAQIHEAEKNIPAGGLGAQTHGPLGANVFVFHIPNEWVERDLALHFAQFGPILSARIAADKTSGRRLGFGFVSFTTVAAARNAVEAMNGFSVAGKRLKVTIKRGEQQYAVAPLNSLDSEKTHNGVHPNADSTICRSPRGKSGVLSSVPKAPILANGDDSGGSSTDTGKCSKFSDTTRDESSVPTAVTATEASSAKAALSDISSNARHSHKASTVCDHCRKSANMCRSHANDCHRCVGAIALERLESVKKVLTKLYKRIGSTMTPLPDDMWLDILTNLLRTEQGRYFIFTLLMAAGLDLEMEHGEHQEDDQLSSASTESSQECVSPLDPSP